MNDTLLAELRETDRAAYLSILTAPAAKRPALVALASFAGQLGTVPLMVREPAAGEIRLQWWADVARGERDGEARGNPIASALLDAIVEYDLPREALARMAEARSAELYSDPMPDREAFEAYAGEIASVPIQCACLVLDGDAAARSADAAGHAGVFATIVRLLRSLPRERAAGRMLLPADVLLKGWVAPPDLLDPSFAADERATRVVDVLASYAGEHRTAYRSALSVLPVTLAPAFAPVEAAAAWLPYAAGQGGAVVKGLVPRWNEALIEQKAVLGTARFFQRSPSRSLLGRFRETLRRRPT